MYFSTTAWCIAPCLNGGYYLALLKNKYRNDASQTHNKNRLKLNSQQFFG